MGQGIMVLGVSASNVSDALTRRSGVRNSSDHALFSRINSSFKNESARRPWIKECKEMENLRFRATEPKEAQTSTSKHSSAHSRERWLECMSGCIGLWMECNGYEKGWVGSFRRRLNGERQLWATWWEKRANNCNWPRIHNTKLLKKHILWKA